MFCRRLLISGSTTCLDGTKQSTSGEDPNDLSDMVLADRSEIYLFKRKVFQNVVWICPVDVLYEASKQS